MAEWRDILERAADNLSIDQAPYRQQPAGWPAQTRTAGTAAFSGGATFSSSRDMLARELSAAPTLAPVRTQAPARNYRAPITQAIVEPVAAERPQMAQRQRMPRSVPSAKQGRAGREIAALSISVGVMAVTVYGIFALLH